MGKKSLKTKRSSSTASSVDTTPDLSSSSSSTNSATTVDLLNEGHKPSDEGITQLGMVVGNGSVADVLDADKASPKRTGKKRRKKRRDRADPPTPETMVTVPTLRDAMTEVMSAWWTAAEVFDSLKKTGSAIFDEASETSKRKHHKKLEHERAVFDEAASELEQTVRIGLRESILLEQDLDRGVASRHAGTQVAESRGAATSVLTALLRSLMDGAKLARMHGDGVRAGVFVSLANEAHAAGGNLDHGAQTHQEPATDHKGNLATANTVLDTANNVGPGLVGGGIGAAETATQPILTGVTTSASAISSAAAGVFSALGIVFGTIGMALGIKASIRGSSSVKQLQALELSSDNATLRDAVDFATAKKFKKKRRGGATALAGGLAVAAGVAGLVALSVVTLGAGAAILGIGAALIGLSFLIGRSIHKRRKRAAYAKMLAEGLVDAATNDADSDGQAQARAALQARDIDADLSVPNERADAIQQLTTIFAQEQRNHREDTAGVIYHALIGNDVAEQIDAEQVVEALHLDVATIRSLQQPDAISKIAGKMSSW